MLTFHAPLACAGRTIRTRPRGQSELGRVLINRDYQHSLTPPNPKRHEDHERSYEGGHDVSQRDRHSVQPWGKPEHAKQQATNEGADKTHAQISEEAEAFTITGDHQPSEASSKQPDDTMCG